MPGKLWAGGTWKIVTIESDWGNGSGFSKTALTIPKIAVFAPMPRVSMANADSVKPGLLRRPLTAYWSCLASSFSMIFGLEKHAYYHRRAQLHIKVTCHRRATLSDFGTLLV